MTKKKHSFKLSNLSLPTPSKLRKLGITLLAVGVFASGFSLYEGNKIVAGISFGCGVLGTILTNMFAEETT